MVTTSLIKNLVTEQVMCDQGDHPHPAPPRSWLYAPPLLSYDYFLGYFPELLYGLKVKIKDGWIIRIFLHLVFVVCCSMSSVLLWPLTCIGIWWWVGLLDKSEMINCHIVYNINRDANYIGVANPVIQITDKYHIVELSHRSG